MSTSRRSKRVTGLIEATQKFVQQIGLSAVVVIRDFTAKCLVAGSSDFEEKVSHQNLFSMRLIMTVLCMNT